MEQYRKIEKLGEGSFGVVYRAQNRRTGTVVALKRIRLENADEGLPSTAIREIAILKELRHRNIVRLYDVLHSPSKLTLIFEYADMDLLKFIDAHHGTLELCTIKSGELKIADFGLARSFDLPVTTASGFSNEVVTLWYRAPDLLLGSRSYGSSIDMWSVGCVFAEMAMGRPIFPGTSVKDQIIRIYKLLGTPTEKEWPEIFTYSESKLYDVPVFAPVSLPTLIPTLDGDGLDLLKVPLPFTI